VRSSFELRTNTLTDPHALLNEFELLPRRLKLDKSLYLKVWISGVKFYGTFSLAIPARLFTSVARQRRQALKEASSVLHDCKLVDEKVATGRAMVEQLPSRVPATHKNAVNTALKHVKGWADARREEVKNKFEGKNLEVEVQNLQLELVDECGLNDPDFQDAIESVTRGKIILLANTNWKGLSLRSSIQ
ncbi:hypothetical protein KW782_00520, partial [Candidatus Parcubacteria bacterium]|nr:hypothetical protein [Candidatus Parcubacteria bacterium]